jgi:hypothetical protein
MAYYVGLVVFVFDQTHSATWVSAVALSRFLPPILFGSFGGVLSARFERTRLMVRLDLGCAVRMAGLAVLGWQCWAGSVGLAVLGAYHGSASAAIAISTVNSLFVMPYQPAMAAAMVVYCVPTLALLVIRRPTAAFVVEVVRGGGTLVVEVLADALFLIESGTLNVKSHDEANQEVELASLGPGDSSARSACSRASRGRRP